MKLKDSEEEYNVVIAALQWVKTKFMRMWTLLSSIKCLISLITLILLVTGVLLLIAGIVVIVTYAKYEQFIGISFLTLPIFVTVIAAFILCTAALGWYAVNSDKYDLFSAYLALLVAIVIFEIITAVLGFQLEEDIRRGKIINHKMFESRMNYGKGYYSDTVDWDNLHRELECCGYENVYEWGTEIPLSCCPIPWKGKSPFECKVLQSYYTGCYWKLNWLLKDCAFALGATASIVTCLQGIVIAVSAWIAYKMNNKRDHSYKSLLAGTKYSQYQSIPRQTT